MPEIDNDLFRLLLLALLFIALLVFIALVASLARIADALDKRTSLPAGGGGGATGDGAAPSAASGTAASTVEGADAEAAPIVLEPAASTAAASEESLRVDDAAPATTTTEPEPAEGERGDVSSDAGLGTTSAAETARDEAQRADDEYGTPQPDAAEGVAATPEPWTGTTEAEAAPADIAAEGAPADLAAEGTAVSAADMAEADRDEAESREAEPVAAATDTSSDVGEELALETTDAEGAGSLPAADQGPEEEPFQHEGRWWFRRAGELLVYDEQTGQWQTVQQPGATTAGDAHPGGAASAEAAESAPAAAVAQPATEEQPAVAEGGATAASEPRLYQDNPPAETAADTPAPSSAGAGRQEPTSSFWKCANCGAVNGSTATTCRMCFAARP